jgi:hypothetical protein
LDTDGGTKGAGSILDRENRAQISFCQPSLTFADLGDRVGKRLAVPIQWHGEGIHRSKHVLLCRLWPVLPSAVVAIAVGSRRNQQQPGRLPSGKAIGARSGSSGFGINFPSSVWAEPETSEGQTVGTTTIVTEAAAVGFVIGAVVGAAVGNPLAGAFLGAVVGAIAGDVANFLFGDLFGGGSLRFRASCATSGTRCTRRSWGFLTGSFLTKLPRRKTYQQTADWATATRLCRTVS